MLNEITVYSISEFNTVHLDSLQNGLFTEGQVVDRAASLESVLNEYIIECRTVGPVWNSKDPIIIIPHVSLQVETSW